METKSDRNDNIVILRDFNCTINKRKGMVEIKWADFMDVVLIISCQN